MVARTRRIGSLCCVKCGEPCDCSPIDTDVVVGEDLGLVRSAIDNDRATNGDR